MHLQYNFLYTLLELLQVSVVRCIGGCGLSVRMDVCVQFQSNLQQLLNSLKMCSCRPSTGEAGEGEACVGSFVLISMILIKNIDPRINQQLDTNSIIHISSSLQHHLSVKIYKLVQVIAKKINLSYEELKISAYTACYIC